MKHIMTGEWKIPGSPDMMIDCCEVIQYINFKNIKSKEIDINEISHKPLDCIDQEDSRYILANINFPGIVVNGMHNPHNKQYRMIDGRHRLLKTINIGKKTFCTYVLDPIEIKKFYKVFYG